MGLSILSEIYECDCLYDCLFKYLCGIVSIFFIIVYGIAAIKVRTNKNFSLDKEDRLLLSLALGQTIAILLYHVFYEHYVFLFIYRISTIL
jgi:hypothetical protein